MNFIAPIAVCIGAAIGSLCIADDSLTVEDAIAGGIGAMFLFAAFGLFVVAIDRSF